MFHKTSCKVFSNRRGFCKLETRLSEVVRKVHSKLLTRKYLKQTDKYDNYESLHQQSNNIFRDSKSFQNYEDGENREFRKEQYLSSYKNIIDEDNIISYKKSLEQVEQDREKQMVDFFSEQDVSKRKSRLKNYLKATKKGQEVDFTSPELYESDYYRFDDYNNNFATMRDSPDSQTHFDQNRDYNDYLGSMFNQFSKQLSKDSSLTDFNDQESHTFKSGYQTHTYMDTKIDSDRSLESDYLQSLDPENNDKYLNNEDYFTSNVVKEDESGDFMLDFDQESDEQELPQTIGELEGDLFMMPHFAYGARRELYHKYVEGASIKDLAEEYGLYPLTVKVIIALENKFLEEYLPFWDEEELELVLTFERVMDSQPNAISYGLDLDKMSEEQTGGVSYAPNFVRNNRMPDRKHNPEIRKMWVDKRPNSEEIIETFKGGNINGYFINQLKVYKGDEAEHVGDPFERHIKYSHIKGHMPIKNHHRINMNQGPRHAVKGIQPN